MTSVVCPACGLKRPLADEPVAWVRCLGCLAMLFRQTEGPPVLVAHESEPIAQRIGAALMNAGFWPLVIKQGNEILDVMQHFKPKAVVVDVGLADLHSFELVEMMRRHADWQHTKIVLVASIFKKTAYKRQPRSLYGADDYVEQHHIFDALPRKLGDLLAWPITQFSTRPISENHLLEDGNSRWDLYGQERVKALARSIIADIALYHEQEITELRYHKVTGNILASALDEGRHLLASMTQPNEICEQDPIGEALENFLRGLESSRP